LCLSYTRAATVTALSYGTATAWVLPREQPGRGNTERQGGHRRHGCNPQRQPDSYPFIGGEVEHSDDGPQTTVGSSYPLSSVICPLSTESRSSRKCLSQSGSAGT